MIEVGWSTALTRPPAMFILAQQLKLTDDRLSVSGDKGYCSVRSTHCKHRRRPHTCLCCIHYSLPGVSRGAWYYEVTVTSMPTNTAARIGWAQHLANLQTPIGTDKFGYAWRSRKGTAFHEASGVHYSNGGFAENDVLGCLIILPETTPPSVVLPRTYKKLVGVYGTVGIHVIIALVRSR